MDGTSTQGAVSDFFTEEGLTYQELTFQANPELRAAFIEDQCDAWSSDKSQLGGHQFTLKADGIDAVVLPETLSKEPLGPSVRDYDSEWEDVVRWVVNGMIIAEEQGVTMDNVDQMAANPAQQHGGPSVGCWIRRGRCRRHGHRTREDSRNVHAERDQAGRQLR